MDLPASSSRDIEVPKLNEEHTEQKDNKQNDKYNFDLPPEYDENDSRWTLKYREPAPGLVELMEHSGVYIKADKLARCKKMSKDYHRLAEILLYQVFTINALSTCALPAVLCNAFRIDEEHGRPELPTHATTTLLNFVAEYGQKRDWKGDDYGRFLKNICTTINFVEMMERKKKQIRKRQFLLAPKYDERYPRWTLKYREPAPGLVELMEHSGVYVNADKLDECKKLSKDCHRLAQMLLSEVFSTNALNTCALPVAFCKASSFKAEHDRIELDSHATTTLLKFVAEYGLKQDWEVTDYHCILNSIRNKIAILRGSKKGNDHVPFVSTEYSQTQHCIENSNTTRRQRPQDDKTRWRREMNLPASSSRDTEVPKLNEEHTEQKDKQNDKCNFVVPPEYDANDSRWTLKYREPAPGLVELMEHSGVYVNADKLDECKKLSKDCRKLAQMLSSEVFSRNALGTCALPVALCKAFGFKVEHVTLELDSHATTTLLKFVAEYGLQQDWEGNDYQCILNGIRNKIAMLRGPRKGSGHVPLTSRGYSQTQPCIENANTTRRRQRQDDETRRRREMNLPASSSRHTEVPKLNEEHTEQKDKQNDKCKFVVPPEYDANDSRWTLKYREPAPGLVELMEHSGVFVYADKLARCMKLSKDYLNLAEMLVYEVFTTNALSTCTLPAILCNAFRIHVEHGRPELPTHATTSLLYFVAEFGLEMDWKGDNYGRFLKNICTTINFVGMKERKKEQIRKRQFDLPPKYDECYTRWTLKYREPAPGLVELMEHSGVYVHADKLDECKKLSKDCHKLTQMLSSEVFSTNALGTCALPVALCKAFGFKVEHDRLELNSHATTTLLKFVAEYGLEQDWEVVDYQCILNSILIEIAILRGSKKGNDHIPFVSTEYSQTQPCIDNANTTRRRRQDDETRRRREMDLPASSSRDTEVPKLNEEHTEQEDKQNDTCKFVLPPEYDANNSRWTLKYREPAPGLVELMEHSGVYVNADKLDECKKLSKDCHKLAQILSSEIFSTNALDTCALPVALCEAFGFKVEHDRLELDSHATTTLLKFVAEYGLEQDWEVTDYQCILNSIRNEIKDRESAPRLVELMEHSSVYVNALGLLILFPVITLIFWLLQVLINFIF